ncbi:MAG: hypothetical protein HY786_07090 [Deltaproteobacteria bacterium]|nr:hypothetical protein [Deltaproteobacteria bacterium]
MRLGKVAAVLLVASTITAPLSLAYDSPATKLKKAGFSEADIAIAKKAIEAACPSGVNPEASLTKKVVLNKEKNDEGRYKTESESFRMEMVETKDKCFEILYADFDYLYDERAAFYRVDIDYFSKPLVFIDYPSKYPGGPSRQFSGVIKGFDVVKYKDSRGIPRTAPHFIVIQEYRKRK